MIFAKPLLILSMLIGTLQAQHQLKQTQEWQREQQKQHKERKGTQQQKLPQQFLLPHQRAQLPPGVGDDVASGEEAGKREMTVRMPVKYTAMQENLEVVFTLARANAAQYNAMIHVEYLAGDSILPNESILSSKARKLASLPVPLGIRDGVVVFQCGTVRHAGPHRAFLTVNGERVAESEILHASWPLMSITAPSRLETHSTDVSVTVSFTRSLCKTFTTFGDLKDKASPFFAAAAKNSANKKGSTKLGFASQLDLVECARTPQGSSEKSEKEKDCQAPAAMKVADDRSRRLWWSMPVANLFRRSSFTVTLNCSVWGQSGTFRLFLRTNLSHAGIVARSAPIRVGVNRDYQVKNVEAPFVLPCVGDDVKVVEVRNPRCADANDRIRVYGQGQSNLTSFFIFGTGQRGEGGFNFQSPRRINSARIMESATCSQIECEKAQSSFFGSR